VTREPRPEDHAIKVSSGYQDFKRTHCAHCSCGWHDPAWHHSEDAARAAGETHRKEESPS
jgi:hypothetical protein